MKTNTLGAFLLWVAFICSCLLFYAWSIDLLKTPNEALTGFISMLCVLATGAMVVSQRPNKVTKGEGSK